MTVPTAIDSTTGEMIRRTRPPSELVLFVELVVFQEWVWLRARNDVGDIGVDAVGTIAAAALPVFRILPLGRLLLPLFL
jgi:hypothetical protein